LKDESTIMKIIFQRKLRMSQEELGYMKWVTNNVDTLMTNEMNHVACVYCRTTYETKRLRSVHNCLVCEECGVDAVMVIQHSPLNGLSKEEQQLLLDKWHIEGFTPIDKTT
jgi:hypothetical protein